MQPKQEASFWAIGRRKLVLDVQEKLTPWKVPCSENQFLLIQRKPVSQDVVGRTNKLRKTSTGLEREWQLESQYPNPFLRALLIKVNMISLHFHHNFCCCSPVRTELEKERNITRISLKQGWKHQWIYWSKAAVNSCIQSFQHRKDPPSQQNSVSKA